MLLSLFIILFPPVFFSMMAFCYQTLSNVSNGIFKITEVPGDRAFAHIPVAEAGSARDGLRV
jgi:hypothetical protein